MTSEVCAAEATIIARNYVTTMARTPVVCIDEVTLHETDRTWEVRGSYRSNPFARSRSFQLQLGAENGLIMAFTPSPPGKPLAPLLTGIAVIVGALFFLAWIVFLNR